jgi:NTP pyrophosphatase (non-canonical NTP hydrolase)
MLFEEMNRRALHVRSSLESHELNRYGRPCSLEELMLGLIGDVGDLAKLVQAHEGVRDIEDARAKLEHELADVLGSVLVIASRCGVDLESAFATTMDEIERALAPAAP